jgi:nucleotide-binding universal stress UspA family protein
VLRTIAVGIDGSDGARAAVRLAVDEASFHHVTLRPVHAWTIVPVAVPPLGEAASVFPTPEDIELLREGAQKLLDDAVEQALRVAKDRPMIEPKLVQARPAEALLAEA